MKKLLSLSLALLAAAAMTVPTLAASHTVQRGDTMWKLARAVSGRHERDHRRESAGRKSESHLPRQRADHSRDGCLRPRPTSRRSSAL